MENKKRNKRTYDDNYSVPVGTDSYDNYEEDDEDELVEDEINELSEAVAIPDGGVGEDGEQEEEEEEVQIDYTNKIIVENITYIPVPGIKKKKYKFLDKSMILDIPQNLIEMRQTKPRKEYEDAIETFVYNIVSKKMRFQVAHCQIFLCDKKD